MCKLYVVTGPLSRAGGRMAAMAASCAFAPSQRDGFGLLAAGAKSRARGRYKSPGAFLGFGAPGLASKEEGEWPWQTRSLIIHGRTSTNVPGLDNCHPFKAGSLYCAHNGILDWRGKGPTPEPVKGCDTHRFLNWVRENGDSAWRMTAESWSGYAAAFFYDAMTGVTTLVKCANSRLWGARRTRGGWVFSTTLHDLKFISRRARIKLSGEPVEIKTALARFAPDGEVLTWDERFQGFADRRRDALTLRSLRPEVSRRPVTVSWSRSSAPEVEGEREPFPDWEPGLNLGDDAVQQDAPEAEGTLCQLCERNLVPEGHPICEECKNELNQPTKERIRI